MRTIPSVIAQHAEEVAFLFLLRERLAGSRQFGLAALAEIDARIDAHLDGLRAGGEDAWAACARALESGEFGELFAAAVVALESRSPADLERVVGYGEKIPRADRALLCALEWVEPPLAARALEPLLASPVAAAHVAGLRFAAAELGLPAERLTAALRSPAPELRCAGLAAARRQGALDAAPLAAAALDDADLGVREQAACTATLLGVAPGPETLWRIAASESVRADAALDLAVRALASRASSLLQELLRDPAQSRRALVACAALGDPDSLFWVVEQMADPGLSRSAGAAFAALTGLDLTEAKLALPADAAPLPDDDAPPSADSELPAPDPQRVRAWLDRNARALRAAAPLLAGRRKVDGELRDVLRAGRQSERRAAALEITLARPGTPLFDVGAPAFRQLQRLEAPAWR